MRSQYPTRLSPFRAEIVGFGPSSDHKPFRQRGKQQKPYPWNAMPTVVSRHSLLDFPTSGALIPL
jgi:hypothetical protein